MRTTRAFINQKQTQDALTAFTHWLSSLAVRQTWLLLSVSIAIISIADLLFFPLGVTCGPFYMLPICLACWQLDLRSTLIVIVVTAILSIMTFVVYGRPMTTFSLLGNLAVLIFVPGLIVLIVNGLRSSVDRQRKLAHHDFLTGALNTMGFAHEAATILSSPTRTNKTWLLCFIDLDGFKQVNDRHGHEIGDQTLRQFGAKVRTSLRAGDCFGRIGGDEFAWLIPVEQSGSARDVAEILHHRLIDILARQHDLGCSLGALILPPDHWRPLDELMRAADQLMYRAKRSGKNQLRIASISEMAETEANAVADGAPSAHGLASRHS
jgi:diguanylate cyclase (GGDEF)-like protein